jgi:hypothetical protein
MSKLTFILVALFAAREGAIAETGLVELKWTELAPVIRGHRVRIDLPGGSVTGEALVVREDALVMDVAKLSGATAYRKGSAAIPRSAITRITVERSRGNWGRNLGTVLGVVGGLMIGSYTAVQTADSAAIGIPVFLGVSSGVTREIDRRVTVIQIVP